MPIDDRSEYEPDEPDLGPDVPEVEIPSVAIPDESAASTEVARAFWIVVLLLNVGIFAGSLGLLLAAFRGQYRLGAVLALVGTLAFAHAYHRYRQFRHED